MIFNDIVNKLILNEDVSIGEVNDVIDRHKRVIINYHTKGEDKNTGARVIEVYAYGLTKAGNPVIRCFQPYGDTTSRVPSWKFFRLDRISAWRETNQTFNRPASFFYKGLGDFNPDDDETMSVVYKIAKFGNNKSINTDIHTPSKGPRMKSNPEPYKTDTERGMERLRQQLQNPRKIDLDNLRKKLGDTSRPIKYSDLVKRVKGTNGNKTTDEKPNKPIGNDGSKNPEPYKTDTERGMERLRQQLQNPRKIDLDNLRRK